MGTVIQIPEVQTCVQTTDFQYGKWSFPTFNIVQSAILPVVNLDCNVLIATATASGKTVMSELFGSYELRKNKKKMLFLCPLRSLAIEKYTDWTNTDYHFSDLKVGIFTGDFKDSADSNNIENFDIIIMTSEMLNHKIRNSKKLTWVDQIGTLIIDESHLLTVEGRGDHLEAAIINFSKLNQNARFVLLSATLPNVNDVAQWLSTSINGKDTYVLKSDYRPCPLKIHICKYDDDSPVRSSVHELVDDVCKCALRYAKDKFLIFVHAKKIGEMIVEALNRRNVKVDFHNANLDKNKRMEIEDSFKNKDARILVSTSTLAWGINCNARRVIVAGVTRGPEVVPSYDILQMIGRAGRPPADTEGDAYIFLPDSRSIELSKQILKPLPISSRILDVSILNTYDTLAFHILSEVLSGSIKNKSDINNWYNKTLCSFQGVSINENILANTIDRMIKNNLIKNNDETNEYEISSLGKVSCLFYYNPFDLSNLVGNFSKLFQKDSFDDIDVCLALSNIGSNIIGSLSKQDRIDMQKFLEKIESKKLKQVPDNVLKIAFLYYKILHGRYEIRHTSLFKTLQNDIPRIIEVLKVSDSMFKKWNKKEFFSLLAKRALYGVPAKLVNLVEINGIGKIRAEKLYNRGFKNKQDILCNLEEAARIAGVNKDKLKDSIQ